MEQLGRKGNFDGTEELSDAEARALAVLDLSNIVELGDLHDRRRAMTVLRQQRTQLTNRGWFDYFLAMVRTGRADGFKIEVRSDRNQIDFARDINLLADYLVNLAMNRGLAGPDFCLGRLTFTWLERHHIVFSVTPQGYILFTIPEGSEEFWGVIAGETFSFERLTYALAALKDLLDARWQNYQTTFSFDALALLLGD